MVLSVAALILMKVTDSGTWPCYGRDNGGERYVQAQQITKGNVNSLRPIWTFHTHDLSDGINKPFSAFECTPIFDDDSLYIVSPFNRVFSLDPDTGEPHWTYDPEITKTKPEATEPFACRGLASWLDPNTGARRIFLSTYDGRLIALDSKTGQPISTFGQAGTVDLRKGIGTRYLKYFHETSPVTVIGHLVVVGSSILDNLAVDMPSGVVRAYDALSGKLVWSWDPCANFPPLPKLSNPAEAAYLKGAKTGAGNAWAPISADAKEDLVFVPTGSASPDYFGGYRPGNDADADSVVALRASTGKKVWAFQTVHHDLWDYDVPAEPILGSVAGQPAVIVMTKMGYVFVLNRLTGKPILPIKETKVPTDGVPGESYAETQPVPVLPRPLVPTTFKLWALQSDFMVDLKLKLYGKKIGPIFTPVGTSGTVELPGTLGGCNWSGGSFDPTSTTLYVNTNNMANLATLVPRKEADFYTDISMQLGTPYGLQMEPILNPGQVPATTPPWGVLHAIDLSTGAVRWQKPLGYMPQLADRAEAPQWGSPNLGGSFVTSTGLVFIAATLDPHLRAFDAATGKVLWEFELPAGGQATPMSFISPKTHRQIVVQCAGGHHGLGSPQGDSVLAFSLPQ